MTTFSKQLSKRAAWSIFMGVLTAAIGVVMMIYPLATATLSVAFVGSALFVAGVAQVIYAFNSETPGSSFLKLLLGVVYGIAGVALAAFPPIGVLTLTGVLGWMLVVEAILEAIAAFALAGAGRGWLVVNALVSLALGVMILSQWPSSSAWAIGTLVGAALLTNGIMRVAVSAAARHEVQEEARFPKAA
jgi:uncharacterized membrane protein HdeD (DUF308 family)